MSPRTDVDANAIWARVSMAARPSFDTLYREHAQTVARWAVRLGGRSIDLEDAVQEVFMIASRRLADYRGEGEVSSWLYGITRKIVANHRRRQRWRFWRRATDKTADVVASPGPGPDDELEHRQARVAFDRILHRLPEKYRSVLVLFELEGLSTREIAVLTGIKPATVKVHLHRARALFLEHQRRLFAEGVR